MIILSCFVTLLDLFPEEHCVLSKQRFLSVYSKPFCLFLPVCAPSPLLPQVLRCSGRKRAQLFCIIAKALLSLLLSCWCQISNTSCHDRHLKYVFSMTMLQLLLAYAVLLYILNIPIVALLAQLCVCRHSSACQHSGTYLYLISSATLFSPPY